MLRPAMSLSDQLRLERCSRVQTETPSGRVGVERNRHRCRSMCEGSRRRRVKWAGWRWRGGERVEVRSLPRDAGQGPALARVDRIAQPFTNARRSDRAQQIVFGAERFRTRAQQTCAVHDIRPESQPRRDTEILALSPGVLKRPRRRGSSRAPHHVPGRFNTNRRRETPSTKS